MLLKGSDMCKHGRFAAKLKTIVHDETGDPAAVFVSRPLML